MFVWVTGSTFSKLIFTQVMGSDWWPEIRQADIGPKGGRDSHVRKSYMGLGQWVIVIK